MKRILLNISYKGTSYAGFQKQKNANSIQSELEESLYKLFNEKITVTASGRTDAKVHAINQYVHFDTTKNIAPNKIVDALNTFLPNTIVVKSAKEVDMNFNARFCAKQKTYMYVMQKGKVVEPYLVDLVASLKENVDVSLMQKVAQKLVGTHNFKAFCAAHSSVKDFERTIYSVDIQQKDSFIVVKICGNGFLYNMVRIIVGTLVMIASGQKNESVIDEMFLSGNRQLGGKTFKPEGLYLYDVKYE